MRVQPLASGAPLPVTVVIPVYNRAAMITRALASVAAQRPAEAAELIVVDDGSWDDTASVAEGLGATVIRHPRRLGAAAARNTGIGAASQPWVALLDSDEQWLPHHLSGLSGIADGHVLASGSALVCGADSSRDRLVGALAGEAVVLESPAALVFPENIVVAGATMMRRDIVDRVGGFDTRLRYAEDLDLWLRVLEHGTGVVSPDVSHLIWRHGGHKSRDPRGPKETQSKIVDSYAGRPWWSAHLAERRLAVRRRDEIGPAWRAGRRREALDGAAWIAARPSRARAVLEVERRRRLQRRLGSTMSRDGRAAEGPVMTPRAVRP